MYKYPRKSGAIPKTQKLVFAPDNKIAYTEDLIEVFSLFLGHIPDPITEDDLREHFLRYGEVKSIEIKKKKVSKNRVLRYGFINFKYAESAWKALFCREQYIGRLRIYIKPADSWKQPAFNQQSDDVNENNASKSSILTLNEDCLRHVCSFLTFREQINLSETCSRLSGVLDIIGDKNKVLTISAFKPVTFKQLRRILSKVGHKLHQIEFIGEESVKRPIETFKYISETCPNLKDLRIIDPSDFYNNNLNRATFREIALNISYLTKLELTACEIDDDICQTLVPLQNLELIDFSFNDGITGRYLDEFPKLKHLDLSGCSRINSFFLSNICAKGLLQSLHVIGCTSLNADFSVTSLLELKYLEENSFCSLMYLQNGMRTISEFSSLKSFTVYNPQFLDADFFKELDDSKSEKLESIKLFGFNLYNVGLELECICKFKNLKKLCIFDNETVSDSFVQKLSDLKHLKYLCLAYCKHVTSDSIIKLFGKSTEIKDLDISGCKNIVDYSIFRIAENIKTKGTKSRCTIYAVETEVSPTIMKKKLDMHLFVLVSFKGCPLHTAKSHRLIPS